MLTKFTLMKHESDTNITYLPVIVNQEVNIENNEKKI